MEFKKYKNPFIIWNYKYIRIYVRFLVPYYNINKV